MHAILLFGAKYLLYIIVLFAFIFWLRQQRDQKLKIAVFGIITALTTYLLMKLGGSLYFDPRPFVSNPSLIPLYPHIVDNGFPSDHAALSASVAFTLLVASRRLGAILLVLALFVGVSRVIGNIHSPIDILGSFIFAALGATVAYFASPKILAMLRKSS